MERPRRPFRRMLVSLSALLAASIIAVAGPVSGSAAAAGCYGYCVSACPGDPGSFCESIGCDYWGGQCFSSQVCYPLVELVCDDE